MSSITEKIDAITGIDREYRVAVTPAPKAVKIELTGSCDYRCYFCATGSKLVNRSHMDFDFYLSLLPQLKALGVEELGLFYLGESFLYPRLPEAIKAARERGFPYIFLTTNGRTATPDRVRECISAGLDSLKFSFNWADGDQMKGVTQVDAFDRVKDHIKQAAAIRDEIEAKTGHHCGIYASSIKYHGEQQERMKEAIAEIQPYLDEHYYLPLYNPAGLAESDENEIIHGNQGRAGMLRPPLPCWAIFTEARITSDGQLTACCFDHDGKFEMGDLHKQSFMEIWNSPEFCELRAEHLKGNIKGTICEGCV